MNPFNVRQRGFNVPSPPRRQRPLPVWRSCVVAMCTVLGIALMPGVSPAEAAPAVAVTGAAAGVKTAAVLSAAGFVHPGILVDKADLDFTRSKMAFPRSCAGVTSPLGKR